MSVVAELALLLVDELLVLVLPLELVDVADVFLIGLLAIGSIAVAALFAWTWLIIIPPNVKRKA